MTLPDSKLGSTWYTGKVGRASIGYNEHNGGLPRWPLDGVFFITFQNKHVVASPPSPEFTSALVSASSASSPVCGDDEGERHMVEQLTTACCVVAAVPLLSTTSYSRKGAVVLRMVMLVT